MTWTKKDLPALGVPSHAKRVWLSTDNFLFFLNEIERLTTKRSGERRSDIRKGWQPDDDPKGFPPPQAGGL